MPVEIREMNIKAEAMKGSPLPDAVRMDLLERVVGDLRTRVADLTSLLHQAERKIKAMEEGVGALTGAVQVDENGNLTIRPIGELRIASSVKVLIQGTTITLDTPSSMLEVGHVIKVDAPILEVGASTMKVAAGSIRIDTGMTDCSGVLKCGTLIAMSVVSSSYTPGAGNIW